MPDEPDREEARLRRLRLLRRGMENLGNLPRRAAQVPSTEQTAEPAPEVARTETLSADHQVLLDQIEQRHRSVQAKADHFAVLGIERNANKEAVKNAFLALAKVYHPDRLPAPLSPLASKVSGIFDAIRAAHDALLDDAKRADYLRGLDQSAAAAPAQDDKARAAEAYRKGDAALARRDYADAERCFQAAHAADPKGRYLAGVAWARYLDPGRRAEAASAKQLLHDALQLDANCDRTHYQLGVIARVEENVAKAERHFRETVKLNSRHAEAKQELRLLELKKQKDKRRFFKRKP